MDSQQEREREADVWRNYQERVEAAKRGEIPWPDEPVRYPFA